MQRIAFGDSPAAPAKGAEAFVTRVHTRLLNALACYTRHYNGLRDTHPNGVDTKSSWSGSDKILTVVAMVNCTSVFLGAVASGMTKSETYICAAMCLIPISFVIAILWNWVLMRDTYWAALRAHPEWPALPTAQTPRQRIAGLLDEPERQAFIDVEPMVFGGKSRRSAYPWYEIPTETAMRRICMKLREEQPGYYDLMDEQQERVLALMCIKKHVYGDHNSV